MGSMARLLLLLALVAVCAGRHEPEGGGGDEASEKENKDATKTILNGKGKFIRETVIMDPASPTNNMRGIGIKQGNTQAPFPMRGFEPKETWHNGRRQVARTQVTGDIPAPQTGPFASSRHGDNFASTAGSTHPPVGTWLHPEDEFSSSQNMGPQSGINTVAGGKFHGQNGFSAGAFAPGSMSGGQTAPYGVGYGMHMGGMFGGFGMGGYGMHMGGVSTSNGLLHRRRLLSSVTSKATKHHPTKHKDPKPDAQPDANPGTGDEVPDMVAQVKRQEICVKAGCPDDCPEGGDKNNEACCPTDKKLRCCMTTKKAPCKICECAEEPAGGGARRRRLLNLMRAKMQGGACWWCSWFH